MKDHYIFGFPDEWAKFQERFPGFLKAFDPLTETLNKVRVRTFTPRNHPVDLTVFFLCSVVIEDFTEVSVMAGNGLGTGALKVLRGGMGQYFQNRFDSSGNRETTKSSIPNVACEKTKAVRYAHSWSSS